MPDRVLRARWVLPDAFQPACRDGWVAIERGRIEAMGEGPAPAARETIDLGAAVLLPGLCLAHTHVDYGLLRGHGDGLPFAEWIGSLTRRRLETMDEARYLESARLSVGELLAAGVTAVGEATTPGDSAVLALREAGLKAVCFPEVFDSDPAHAPQVLAEVEGRIARLQALAKGSCVSIGLSPHAPYSLSRPLLDGLVALGRARDLPLSIHCAETRSEDEFCLAGDGPFAEFRRRRGIPVDAPGSRPYQYLVARGALAGPRPVLLAHGVHLAAEDLADLATRPHAHLVHCPRSNARLGCAAAPVREALAAGVSVLLGSDGACSADRLDPFEEMRAALYAARTRAQDPTALRARDALHMTLAGHRALGLGPGRIEAGAPADLCAVSMAARHWQPAADLPPDEVAAALVLRATPGDVLAAWVDGEPRYDRARDGMDGFSR